MACSIRELQLAASEAKLKFELSLLVSAVDRYLRSTLGPEEERCAAIDALKGCLSSARRVTLDF